jgi:protease IV
MSTTGWITKALLGVTALSLVLGVLFPHKPEQRDTQDIKSGKTGVSKLFSGDRLLKINLQGPISMEGDTSNGLFASESNAMAARHALEKALTDDSVKGVLIRIDSPGGTVGMSQELNAAIKRLLAKGKPVVASLGDIAASGGYYTACAASQIVANPGTLTGSIGVILSTLNMKGLLVDKLGLKPVTIKSGKFKDLLSPYRDTAKEEVALLQHMIDTSYQQFLHAVLDGRVNHLSNAAEKARLTESIKAVADGRVVVATEALKAGLVDKIGDEHDAYKLLVSLVQQTKPGVRDDIPLEDVDDRNRLMDWLGISATAFMPAKPAVLPAWADVPFSAKHPNQPLWMVE